MLKDENYKGPPPYVEDDRPYKQRRETLPRALEAVTRDWLTGVLANRTPGLVVNDMEIVEIRNGHTTKMRVKLDLNATGRASGLPEHVCLKSNWSGAFENVDIHALEARFYHYIPQVMDLAIPKSYFADWDPGPTGQGMVILEDLALAGGSFGQSTDHMGVEGVARGLAEYAVIHGKSWDHPALERFAWLPKSMETPIDYDQLELMWSWAEKNIAKPEYQALLPRWLHDRPEEFKRLFHALGTYERAQPGPYSICHGDSHQGNSYLRPDGTRIRMDWQLARKGRPWRDIAYFIIGSLTIAERRANERDLLGQYREHLVAAGAVGVPPLDSIWDAYRRWAIYGCQAWIANMDEWGQKGYPMNERFFTALEDLETVRLLDG